MNVTSLLLTGSCGQRILGRFATPPQSGGRPGTRTREPSRRLSPRIPTLEAGRGGAGPCFLARGLLGSEVRGCSRAAPWEL